MELNTPPSAADDPAPFTDYFWAKTDPITGAPARTVTEHSFQAGAVAECLWAVLGEPVIALLPRGSVTLAALHDVGKLTIGFQLQCGVWKPPEAIRTAMAGAAARDSISRHATLSQRDLELRLGKARAWARAIGAHHGAFTEGGKREDLRALFDPIRGALVERIVQRFGALPVVPPATGRDAKVAQLCCLAGFIVLVDWIASDERNFPLAAPSLFSRPFTGHDLELAEEKAREAVAALRLAAPRLKAGCAFQEYVGKPPYPLQEKALEHIAGPGLYIVEAAMGEGKTEAALAAAYRNIERGLARGFYFALPTQLTSNEIHRRTREIFSRLVESDAPMPLAHSASWLTQPDRLILHPAVPQDADQDEIEQAVQHLRAARAWLTSRKALLAPFGVGTIDQALMATLPVKFAHLRLFGLAGKVIIFDEVHSYDTYTSAILEALIRLLLELHCTVVVLSATLTRRQRDCLLRAATDVEPESKDERWEKYPLLSIARKGAPPEPVTIEESNARNRTVLLTHVTMADPSLSTDVLATIEQRVKENFCVLIIRNTVALAQETYREVKGLLNEADDAERVGLLHSRYPYFQRFGHPDRAADRGREARWVERLGKERQHRPSGGCVLVATQVVEQSVDVDADLLITDLCPTDQLLQRIGRLHRHPEPRTLLATRAEAILLHPVLPQPSEADPAEWKRALKPHGNLYAPYVLLRTEVLWRKNIAINLPQDIRPLLEATYAAPADDEPADWSTLADELQKRRDTLTAKAQAFASSLGKPPESDDENTAPTRWIDCPTLDLVLLRSRPEVQPGGKIELHFLDGAILHWHPRAGWDHEVARAVFINSVRIPAYLFAKTEAPDWLHTHTHGLAGAAWKADRGTLMNCADGSTLPLRYCDAEGVVAIGKAAKTSSFPGEAAEFPEDEEDGFN
ncbi:MAG: CRISPR-associated helicase Cas3' [Verrucomicrobiales bacterium]